ncbi:MAG: hypothetical protein Q8R98_09310, partial [Rubrivivax sp.]|nr:hypothetical protein [Rubrivivax sp.]
PRHLRESVHGDLLEQHGGAHEALALALHFQAEPYRDGIDRRCALMFLLAAAGLLWIVPLAAESLLAQATVFGDPFSRTALQLWQAPNVLAAVACGLLIGRGSLLPPYADAARLHIVLLLAPVATLAAPGAMQGALAAGLMGAAAWLAHQNRRASSDQADPA